MKKHIYTVMALAVFIALLVIYLSSFTFTRYAADKAAALYYENLANGNFEKAFDQVGYFNEASDLAPTISYKHARTAWVERVSKLKKQGVFLSDVKNIRVTIDDGYPKGRADVVIITYGVTKEVTEDIHFGRLDGKWKVQNASAGWGNETELEKARSGYIP